MKKTLLLISFLCFSLSSFSQNGTYRCNSQRFTDDSNPTRNKQHSNEMIITINIGALETGTVVISWPAQDAIYQWDIKSKIGSELNRENQTYFTSYDARWNLDGVQTSGKINLVLIEDLSNKSMHIAISGEGKSTTNWYHNLIKM